MNGYNFTERVRKVLAMAREESERLGHEYVGPEHILLGVIREGEGVAAAVLQSFSIDGREIVEAIERVVKPGKPSRSGPDLPYTSRAKKVLEFAMSEARDLNHSYVGTEHLLLGLFREEQGIPAQVLTDFNLTLAESRDEILRLLGGQGPSAEDRGRVNPKRARREWPTDASSAEVEAFGPKLGTLYNSLRTELSWLYVKWDQFRSLYGARNDRLELLNSTSPLFFSIAEEALWNDMTAHIRALTAESLDGARRNTGFREIPDMIEDARLQAEIGHLVNKVIRVTEFLHASPQRRRPAPKPARALGLRARPLDAASHAAVRDALESMAAVLNRIGSHYRQTSTAFDSAAYPHGALSLLHILQLGHGVRDQHRDGPDDLFRPTEGDGDRLSA